jgi:MFS transporter, DHA1 family, multidrug/chloramphenicol efflux transport protein
MQNKKSLYLFAAYFVLYELTTYLSNDMIMPGMPAVVHDFNAPLSSVALSLTFYIIGGSLLQVFLGPLSDVIGKRKVMLSGCILFLIASIIIPFSHSINQFLAARMFQGMGLGFIFIGYAVIHELFNDVEAVKLTALLANIAVVAPLIGPVIGGAIIYVSHWQFIFIVSAILVSISLFGLYKYMPEGKIADPKPSLIDVLNSYKNILTHKIFMFGVATSALSVVPILGWVGLSPVIIMETMHKPFSAYLIYQSIMFAGFIVSSMVVQKVTGRFSFYQIITFGSYLALIGVILAALFNSYSVVFVTGIFLYAFGFGLYNGPIVRIALMDTGETTSLSASIMSLITSVFLAIGLQVSNKICEYFAYSLASFAMITLVIGIIVSSAAYRFAVINKNRVWGVEHPTAIIN